MTEAARLIRHNSALLNNDMAEYHAAKARKKKDIDFMNLIQKVERLEKSVDDLNNRLREMEQNVYS